MSDILTGFNMQGNDPIDDRIVSKSNLETLEQYLNRVPVQKRYYGLIKVNMEDYLQNYFFSFLLLFYALFLLWKLQFVIILTLDLELMLMTDSKNV